MQLGLMLVELKGNVGLTLAALEHLLLKLELGGATGALRTEELRSLLQGSSRLRLTFMIVFPIQSRADRAGHGDLDLPVHCSGRDASTGKRRHRP